MTPLGISNYYNDDLFYKHFIVLYFQDDKKMAGKDKKNNNDIDAKPGSH